jgi:hypothetical protein
MYDSETNPIFQANAPHWRHSSFRLDGWTDTITGFMYEARKQRVLLLKNTPYHWHATVNWEQNQSPAEIASTWKTFARTMSRYGVIGYRVIEITTDGTGNPLNRVHYHILIKSNQTKAELERVIDKAARATKIPYHKQVEQPRNQYAIITYILKINDTPLLFAKGMPFRKIATIGKFWATSKTDTWRQVQEQERVIGEAFERIEIRRLYNHLKGMLPANELRRWIGLNANEPHIAQWASKVNERYLTTLEGQWNDTSPPH